MQRRVGCGIACVEDDIVADPVEVRRGDGIDECLRRAPVELVVAGRHVHRRQRVEVVHRLDHLQPVPELAFERRIQKVTTMGQMHFAALRLQLPDQRHHATETAALAVLDSAYAIRIVEV